MESCIPKDCIVELNAWCKEEAKKDKAKGNNVKENNVKEEVAKENKVK